MISNFFISKIYSTFINKVLLLVCVYTAVFITTATAQKGNINFTALTSKDGLSSNTINAICKDKLGLLWFATDEGLNRFDGKDFKVYRYRPEDTAGLKSKEVVALHEDKQGRLWIGTMGGSLHCYNRNSDTFAHYNSGKGDRNTSSDDIKSICSDYKGKIWIGTLDGVNVLDPESKRISKLSVNAKMSASLDSQAIFCVFEDSHRRMWVGTNKGLYHYNRQSKQFIPFRHNNSNPSSLVSDTVNTIAEDKSGNVWVGTINGLSMLMPDNKTFKNFKFNVHSPQSISSNTIYAIAAEDKDNLWVGTEGGLDIIHVKSGQVSRYKPDGRNKFSLTSRSVRSIFIDKHGICWLGTYEGGINKYDKNLTLFNLKQSNAFDPFGLSAPFITAFAEAANGDVFIGTDGGGLNLFHRKTGLFTHQDIQPAHGIFSSGLPILTMALDRQKQLWIGTFRNGLFIYNTQSGQYRQVKQGRAANEINDDDIFCLKEDHEGRMWVGTNGSGVSVYNPASGTFQRFTNKPVSADDVAVPLNGFIRAIEEDRQGNIWIGSYGSGLAVYNRKLKKCILYDKAHYSQLPSNKILSLLADHQGNIWIGTSGDGLVMLNQKTHTFSTFTDKNGLPNGLIHKILEDKNGMIWMSTNRGISRFDPVTKKFKSFSRYNGLQNNVFMNGAGISTASGELFFGGVEGFNYFNPLEIKTNTTPPVVLITDLKVANKSVNPGGSGSPIQQQISVAKEIVLNYKRNFSISYVALNFTAPQQNQYAYRLVDFDKDWIPAGSSTTATYTNLDPGKYVFEVKACNNDGVWNDKSTRISIIIRPPFWMTVYAYIVYALLFTALLLFIRHRGILKLQKKFALEQEQLKARQAIEQEKREAERLHELDLMKIKFLTNLSHEFRTPISLIMGPAEKMLTQDPGNSNAGQLQMIKRNARRLLNLVNQLLDFRKMEEHELKLNLADGEIISFLKEAADSFFDIAERKRITFKFESQVKQLYASFDHDKLERIIFNLLSNAFKFTPEGGAVTVQVEEALLISSEDKWLRISVTDTGIGIPDDKRDKIFDRFFQDDTVTMPGLNQGSGIGLSITKEFVQMHGGSIEAASRLEKGTVFVIDLPLLLASVVPPLPEPLPTQAPQETVEVTHEKDKKQRSEDLFTILIVEDNDDFRFYLKDNLKLHYKIIEASNGKEGWLKALSSHPNLIVSDISMPYMDGIELSRKIKSDKRTAHIPVILLTALTREEEQLKGLNSGANDYMTKPFNSEILNVRIRNLLNMNRTLKNTYTKQIKVSSSEVVIESSNEKFLSKVVLYVEENMNNSQLSVEDLSGYLGMSRGALYHKLLELTGLSPVEFIRSIKLERAAVLLEKSDLNIAQIAYMAGFATPHYFAKSFKAKFNMLPSEYIAVKRKVSEVKN
ncbi:two-component regulator propeller domain-containing protein [Mucilaginibacter sp. PAMB04168]|uniref:hybrid sensor histidine kinase/response regulator transcription factor n=1 Tax=Mucilaginibacter sp. PAMB04168 TaxID=3138567 RepID=UPI0031F6F1D0